MKAVLLLAHGTPDAQSEMAAYLKNVVSGRPMPEHVVEEIRHRYGLIGLPAEADGTVPPLTHWTLAQAQLLQEAVGMPVYVGMRNWKPYIAETVQQMRADGVTAITAICLAPQNSRTSVGLYRRAAFAEAGEIPIHFIEGWAENPRLVRAFAERLRAAWIRGCAELHTKVPIIFTAHSVPCRTINSAPATVVPEMAAAEKTDGPVRPTLAERSYALPANREQGPDPYAVEAKKTAMLVAQELTMDGLEERDWVFAFQSQGMSGGPWIGPGVEEMMRALKQEGHAGVVIAPIGFLCDHVEILYDIDIAFTELATELEMMLWRPESLNDSPILIEALASLVAEAE